MRKVTPIKMDDLKELSAQGREDHRELPAVWSTLQRGSKGDKANRELANDIAAVLKKHKGADPDGQPFVVAWRLYPNAAHPRWKEEVGCDCGCGCDCA